jgi:hypothetical protein
LKDRTLIRNLEMQMRSGSLPAISEPRKDRSSTNAIVQTHLNAPQLQVGISDVELGSDPQNDVVAPNVV